MSHNHELVSESDLQHPPEGLFTPHGHSAADLNWWACEYISNAAPVKPVSNDQPENVSTARVFLGNMTVTAWRQPRARAWEFSTTCSFSVASRIDVQSPRRLWGRIYWDRLPSRQVLRVATSNSISNLPETQLSIRYFC